MLFSMLSSVPLMLLLPVDHHLGMPTSVGISVLVECLVTVHYQLPVEQVVAVVAKPAPLLQRPAFHHHLPAVHPVAGAVRRYQQQDHLGPAQEHHLAETAPSSALQQRYCPNLLC